MKTYLVLRPAPYIPKEHDATGWKATPEGHLYFYDDSGLVIGYAPGAWLTFEPLEPK